MGFLPCPCTLSTKNSSKHHQQDSFSDIQQINNNNISSQPSLPSVQSLTSHSQPPSTTANHHYITTFKPHTSPIFSLTLTNNHLISASSDGHIRIWPRDPSRDQSVQPPLATIRSAAKTMLVYDNKFLFTGHQDHKIRVWKLDDVNKTVKCVAVLPTLNDRLMKLVFAKNYVKIRRHRRCTWVHHVDAVSALALALALSKDGSLVYSGSWDRTFKVWRTSDYKCLESVWNAHDDAINAVVVSHDCVYTGSADRKIKV